MKYLVGIPLIVMWMTFTLLFACTIFGMIVFLDDDLGWMKFPKRAMNIFN